MSTPLMKDVDDESIKSEDSPQEESLKSTNLSAKQYFLVNISKFIVELIGTAVLGVFFLLMGDQQSGIMLGMWIITLFGQAISGAHFNPAVTIVFMLRKNSTLGTRRLMGIIYIVAQFLGGIIAAIVSNIIDDVQDGNDLVVAPVPDTDLDQKYLASAISELFGSFVFIFLFMLCTDKKTQFSKDKVINCLIISSAYVSSRLMSGGKLVTRLQTQPAKLCGPLLNPALALGQMIISFDFKYIWIYFLMPFGGAALALIFYEYVFVRSQEYLAGDSEDGDNDSQENLELDSNTDIKSNDDNKSN